MTTRPVVFALCLLAFSSAVCADNDHEHDDYKQTTIRLGAFAIGDIDARVNFGPDDLPLRIALDIDKDLGLSERILAFRGNMYHRFSKHHALNIGYYKLDIDGVRTLSETIEIGDTQFDIGIDLYSRYEEQITKVGYNWIFHDEGKVLLSVTPGLHFSKARITVGVLGTGLGSQIGFDESEDASITAPLPMLGGRIVYRMTDKWSLVAISDTFFLNRGSQEGQLNDTHVFAEYRASEHWSLGAGLNRYSLDLRLNDDGRAWDWTSVYTGAYLYFGMHF